MRRYRTKDSATAGEQLDRVLRRLRTVTNILLAAAAVLIITFGCILYGMLP